MLHRLRALRDAEILGGGTMRGMLRLLDHAARLDLHPAVIWGLNAANFPDRTALVQGERRLTWSELDRRANRLAQGLLSLGVGPGDRIACMLRNSIEWFESVAATTKIGAATVLVSHRSTAAELEYLLADSQAAALIFARELRDVVASLPPRHALPETAVVEVGGESGGGFVAYEELLARSSDLEPERRLRDAGSRMILYTSGTTGKPKGAVRDVARSGLGDLLDLLSVIPFRRSDRHLVAAPLYHATGSGFATVHVTLGATIHLMERFEPREFLRLVERERITTTALVPTMLRSVLALPPEERRRDVSSLRVIVCTGSKLSRELKTEARRFFGPVVYDLYGATEMGWVAVATPDDQVWKPDSVGRAVPGTDVVLLSEDRRPVADGEVGELFARNRLTVEGYHRNLEATERSRWGEYFSVGDLAVRDADGFLTIVDRKTDMVISGGMNVYPAEIEQVLRTHPAIADAAVVGVPDEHWGESLVAFVVPRPGERPGEDEIVAHCRRVLSGYKVPRRIRFVEELPRNPTGKVLKKDLRALA